MTSTREPDRAGITRTAQRFKKYVDTVSLVFAVLAGILTVVMALHVTADVSGRNLVNAPITGTIEFITYWWMPMIIFLSIPFVEQKRAHITVTLVTDSLRGATKQRAAAIGKTVSIVIVVFVLYLAMLSFTDSVSIGQTASGGVPLPIWVGKGVMVLGIAQLLLQMIADSATAIGQDVSRPDQAAATRGPRDDNQD